MASLNPNELGAVLPRKEWRSALSQTAVEVFSIMVRAVISTLPQDSPTIRSPITGMVGIAGPLRANFLLRCSSASSVKLASQMLGISPDDPCAKEAARDALAEICNVLAGDFKARIGLGHACSLSLPTVVEGQNFKFHRRADLEHLELPLLYEGDTVWAMLEIAQ